MPKKSIIPKLKLHKATGQAYCRINGETVYFGKYHLPETEQAYKRFIAEYIVRCTVLFVIELPP